MANIVAENEIFFTQFEPQLSNRFLMYIDGIPSYFIRAAQRPKLQNNPKTLPHINIERYVKGKSVWQPLTVTLYEAVAPSGQQAVMEWVRLHHESVTGRNGYMDFYKKDITLNGLGPVGDVVSQWIGKGTQIENADFGDFDWANDEPVNIQLTLRADFWVLNF